MFWKKKTESPIQFEVIRLSSIRESKYSRSLEKTKRDEAYQFAPEPQTRMTVLVTSDRFITGVWTDAEEVEVYSFVDNTGFDLLSKGGGSSATGASPDHRAGAFEVVGRASPDPRAVEVRAVGRVQISHATSKSISRASVMEAIPGARVSAGGFDFELIKTGLSDYGDADQEITLHRSCQQTDLRNEAQIWFEDENENRIDFWPGTSILRGIDDDVEVEEDYRFVAEQKEFRIVVETWTDRVEDYFDYDLRTRLGCV